MKICAKRNALAALVAWALILAASASAPAQEGAVPFDSGRWSIVSGQIVDYLGRKALIGSAYVKDVELKDGVIEVDIAVDGRNAYPSILFRMTEGSNYEHVYIRPHQLGGPMNAIQYAPSNNGIGGWQLWNGDGYTNSLDMPKNEWVHLRLEFKGRQARFFVGDDSTPDLVIDDLKREPVEGLIGLMNANANTAYFSNFSYRGGETLAFEQPPAPDAPPGVVADWKVSQSLKLARVDIDRYPDATLCRSLAWRDVEGDAAGLVDVSRTYGRAPGGADVIYAKTVITADRDTVKPFLFGYSDVVSIFCNGEILFQGWSEYRRRDPTFQGIVGLYDQIWLPLKKGENELMIAVAEAFGGWGFMFRDAKAEFHAPSVTELWRTGAEFLVPETAVWDPARKRV